MYHWKTDDVVAFANGLKGVKKAKATWPGGDYDTRRVVVEIEGATERLFVSGFYSTEECIPDPDDSPVKWVVLTDGRDSRGGLSSVDDNVVSVFYQLRKHFLKGGAAWIINHHDEIF